MSFPHHFYFIEGKKIQSYSPIKKEINEVIAFNPPSKEGFSGNAEMIVHSSIHRAWLVFFRRFSSEYDDIGIEEWTYTIQREDEVGACPPWFNPGNSLF